MSQVFRPIDWTPEEGFPEKRSTDTYPRPAAGKELLMLMLYLEIIFI